MLGRETEDLEYRSLWEGTSLGKNYDRGVVYGIIISSTLLLIGALASGRTALRFFDPEGLAIVFGGTLGAAMVHFPLEDLRRAWVSFKSVLFNKQYFPVDRIQKLMQFAQAVRINGILFLDQAAQTEEDPFLRRALELTVDGQQSDEVRQILETEIRTRSDQAWRAIQVFETMGNYSPALGLIGTVLGLIHMLGDLNNPSTVGPAMATALVATLHGAVLSNLVLLPVAGKLRLRNDEELRVCAITIEGIEGIARQESPMILERKLYSYLPGPTYQAAE